MKKINNDRQIRTDRTSTDPIVVARGRNSQLHKTVVLQDCGFVELEFCATAVLQNPNIGEEK